ncbi:MAG: glycerol-3-phosphate dehydrogenase/oxidase [Actinobacteria bacterium]|nr:glycerol-3-phosphate dehydrogenase/oxidase [Actinomycetota bacterium]
MSASERLSRLGPQAREAATARLGGEAFDLLVVGGGITGAGVALDAATRGLSVALVEKRDFAAGTSSRSSKLIHGGLRYLEQRDFALVREALHERALLLETLAPHLVEAVPFLFPLRHKGWERAYVGAGIGLYDALAGRHAAVPRHRHLSHAAALELAPSLRPDSLVGAIRYFDARTDDARFVVALVRTALANGAVAISGMRVEALAREGGISRVTLRDTERGGEVTARARVVVNATGVWSGELERLGGVEAPVRVRASKGVHILVPRGRIEAETALILRTERSVLFVIPWGAHWIVGTTDTEWRFDRDHPAASRADIRYLLDHLGAVLTEPPGEEDVVGVYAGLRPLVDRDAAATTALSREHVVRRPAPGLVTVAGGKYTTYRLMARDAVDAAAAEMGEQLDPSRTHQVPLLGAEGLGVVRGRARRHPAAAVVGEAAVEHLLGRYGALAVILLDEIAARPELGRPIPGAEAYLIAEAIYAVEAEGALRLDDVLTRRTRISIEAADRGRAAAAPIAAAIAPLLGWSAREAEEERARYLDRLEAEREAAAEPDDAHADAVRRAVRDPRLATPRS